MSRRTTLTALFSLLALVAALLPAAAGAATPPAPSWSIHSLPAPTNFEPGDASGFDRYEVVVLNKGGEETDRSPITITDTLPAGLQVVDVELRMVQPTAAVPVDFGPVACGTSTVASVSTVTCTVDESLPGAVTPAWLFPSEEILMVIKVGVPPSASGVLTNRAQVEGGGAEAAVAESQNPVSSVEASAGFEQYQADSTEADGSLTTQAAGHPELFTTFFAVNLVKAGALSALPFVPAGGDLKEIEVKLPPGLVGNPTATDRCGAKEFNTLHAEETSRGNVYLNDCPDSSAVGLAMIQQLEGEWTITPAPLYNLKPPKGMPAQLGFQIAGLPIYINTRLRSDSDYGITAYVKNTSQAKRVTAATFMIWGTPGLASHDSLRGKCVLAGGTCPGGSEQPFMRQPSQCANPLFSSMSFETWAQPPASASGGSFSPAPLGCAVPDFSPTIEAKPSTTVADSPAGLHVDLHIPQREHESAGEPGEADLRQATVTLPRGLVVNPSSADGLGACSPAQIGLTSGVATAPIHFNTAPVSCPNNSKIGTVEVDTPLLDHPIQGGVYLAQQHENPFGSLLAIYLALEDAQSGIVVKLAGEVRPDPTTGQITSVFRDNPQVPFEDFKLDFFAGSRASLRTPASCGSRSTTTELVPWTAPVGAVAHPADSFAISSGPGGGCPTGALAPKMSAGLANPTAATYSPFNLRLTRDDGSQEISAVTAAQPLGLTAKLAGIPYCSDASIAQAASRSHPGDGAQEIASPSCPGSSRVGSTTAGAGAGPSPFYTSGSVYLAGPYKGAPISLVAIVPAVAGPFDLGVVVDRIALQVDVETAQVTAVADPLPTILAGIPLDLRDLRVDIDRGGFSLAGTSCDPSEVKATVQGTAGGTANLSNRYQLGGCGRLKFKPSISLRLKGGTRRARNPKLIATVKYPKGASANIAFAQVALPHSEFLDQSHIRTICTRVQFAARQCPPGAVYGRARAFTPLLDAPLEGPVYLRSSSHPLPDLVADLDGQVHIALVGRTDSFRGGLRNTFEAAPDAPVSKFVLELRGGKRGLIVNSTNVCRGVHRATVRFVGHNGKVSTARPKLKPQCKKHHKKKKRHKKNQGKRGR